ncbi:hypothetical protein AURDEDRAFT_120112 [Auricularia subglabra TFB-10046 SS5]|nr:hypothetical protein AURDEDRAFT_120112 [Auricularia subglabra TFB-10046 SS5]
MIRVPVIIDRPKGAPANRKREPFTIEDDKVIVEYLATENASGEHRKGNEIWKRLEENTSKKWPRGPAHTAQSWRNHYVNDSNGFDARVASYIKSNRAKRKAECLLDNGDAKRRKLHDEQHEHGGSGGEMKVEHRNGRSSATVRQATAETSVNGHGSAPSRPVSEVHVSAEDARRTPPPSASATRVPAVTAPAPTRAPSAAIAKRPALGTFHGARKTVLQSQAQTVSSSSSSLSSSSRAVASSSHAGTTYSRLGTSGKESGSNVSADVSTGHSGRHATSSASKSAGARSRSASIHSQGSASSLREIMPGAFESRRSSSPRSQPLYPKLSPQPDPEPGARETGHGGRLSGGSESDSRKHAEGPARRASISSAAVDQEDAAGRPRHVQAAAAVPAARSNGHHTAHRSAQVYDDDTEEEVPPAPVIRKTTTRVLITRDPFSNRRIHASSGTHAPASSSSDANRHGTIAEPDVVMSDYKDDEDDDTGYPVGPSANKGKGRAVDIPVATDVQHEAADNVPDGVAAPIASHQSSPDSSPAAQSSPIERLLARSSSTLAAQQQLSDAPKRLPPLRPQPSFSKPRDAPSPFTNPKFSVPNGPIFVRRSEARELMHSSRERVSKSSPPPRHAYSLNAVPPVPSKRRTSVEDDTPTTNGRHMKQPPREFAVPASVSMPLPGEKNDTGNDTAHGHRRRQTFGGYDIPDAGALLRSRERERRRSLRPSSHSHSPLPDERVRRMSDNHGFAPAIVRGVLASAGEDVGAADAVLARMRREAEREAVRALGEIVGDEFEVETSPAPVDVRAVPEVDFSGSGPRRRRTGKWVASVVHEDDVLEREPVEEEYSQTHEEEGAGELEPAQEPWTAEEDALILSGSPLKALKAIDERRGVGAVAARLAALL